MKLRRTAKWLLLALTSAVVLFVAGVAWLLTTESGARWSVARIQGLSGDAIVINDVSGTWASGIVLGSLEYADPETEVGVKNAQIRVDLTRALGGEIYVDHLIVDEVSYRAIDSGDPESSEPASGFSLPISLIVPEASVHRFVIRGDSEQHIDDIRAAIEWKGDTIEVQSASAKAYGVSAVASGKVVLTVPVALSLTADWTMTLGDDELRGHGSIDGDLDELALRHELQSPYPVSTSGSVKLSSPPALNLSSTSNTVEIEAGERVVSLNDIQLQISGWFDGYDAEWRADIMPTDLPPAHLTGTGAGTLDELNIESSSVAIENSAISVNGRLAWEPNLQWMTTVAINKLDPALLLPEWPGSLDGGFGLEGGLVGDALTLAFDNINIEGVVRSQPVLLQGQVHKSADHLDVDALRLDSGKNHIVVNGRYGDAIAMSFDVDIQNLSPYGKDLAGALVAQGQLSGSDTEPTLDVDAVATGLQLGEYAAGQLTVAGRLAANQTQSDFEVTADDLVLSGQAVKTLRTEVIGTFDDHRVKIAGEISGVITEAEFLGGWFEDHWQGQLTDSEFELGRQGVWKQDEATALLASQQQVDIEDVCWLNQEALACIGGSAAQELLQLTGTFENIPLSIFQEFMPEEFELTGSSSAEFTVAGDLENSALTFSAAAPVIDLAFRYHPDDEAVALSVRELQAKGAADPANATMDLSLLTDDGGQLTFDAQVDNWQQENAYVRANLKASLPDADVLALLTTELANISGAVETDLSIEGALSAPKVEGYAKLENGRAEVPRAGIVLDEIQIDARPTSGNKVGFVVSALSGTGRVEAKGELVLSGSAGWPVTATLIGENFEAVRLPGLDVTISPNLEITGSAESLHLRGEVETPRAIIELRDLPDQAVEVSPDVTVYRTVQTDQSGRSPFLIYTDLDLVLGREVRFIGFGLTTDLAGRLALHMEPGRDPEGRGIVTITEGKFQAYGQELNISSGRLVFSGPLDNPRLEVEAIREVEEVTVGVRVTGTGQEPQAAVFSEPAMSDADALSYLVIGRSIEDSSDAEDNRVRKAAATLGLTQFMAVTSEIGTAVGLDEFGLDTDSSTTGAIMAGKQVTPDLHVRYSYGLFDRIGAVLLRYRLNNALSLEAQSGEDQSMDLIYTREKK